MRLGNGKALGSLAAALALAACAGMHGAGSGGWETLIDGERGLENFDRVGDADWHAADGAIVADRKEGKASAFLVTKKSYTPARAVASSSSRACDPPRSPVTRTSVMAVASGNGSSPCISRTKYRRNGMRNSTPRQPPARQIKMVCTG